MHGSKMEFEEQKDIDTNTTVSSSFHQEPTTTSLESSLAHTLDLSSPLLLAITAVIFSVELSRVSSKLIDSGLAELPCGHTVLEKNIQLAISATLVNFVSMSRGK